MEQIIRKAIEGGWEPAWGNSKFTVPYDSTVVDEYEYTFSVREIIMLPSFWQALGKACGWKKYIWLAYPDYHYDSLSRKYLTDDEDFSPDTKYGTDTPYAARYITWQHYAHCFYDKNLTEGWEKAVSYLQDLVAPQ